MEAAAKNSKLLEERQAEMRRKQEEEERAAEEAKRRYDLKWAKLRGAAEEEVPDPEREEGEDERLYLKRLRIFQARESLPCWCIREKRGGLR